MSWHFWQLKDLEKQQTASGKHYLEFLREPSLSSGLYVLKAGTVDEQTPHRADELYFVLKGKARMRCGIGDAAEDQSVGPGSVIFVEARAEHRFHDIQEDLEILVFFGAEE